MGKCLIAMALAASAVSAVFAEAGTRPLRVSILGDSYSTYEGKIPPGNANWYPAPPKARNGVDAPEKTWWHQAVCGLGGVLEKNNSFSGATVCFTAYGKSDRSGSSFVARLYDLGHPDVILVCGATNDSWAQAPLGEFMWDGWTNEDLYSFRPAMSKMCAELRALYPKATVAFVLNDGLSKGVNDSVHTVCAHYGICCIDLKNISKKEGHPDADGMKAMAEQVVAALGKPAAAHR